MDKKALGFIVLAAFTFALVAGGGYYFGYQSGLRETKNIVIENVSNAEVPENVSADFRVFWEAWDVLKREHTRGEEITAQELLYGAIQGLAGAFKDPNTVFFTPEDSLKFGQDIAGNFSGIGAEIGLRNSRLIVIAPLKGSPAERAGLEAGDIILAIDGESTEGITVETAIKQIRGELGTTVTLTVFRDDGRGERDVSIVRENIQVPTVEWEMRDGNIIYLELFSFSANTPLAFQQAMIAALLQGGDGMVLDLRSNPGGLLDVAVHLAGWFLDRGDVVVTEKFTSGEERVFRARGNEALADFPVVVLIDGGSASASEILAGALRYHRNVPIVGEKSFGKGTVQELVALSDGSTLKVTVADWLLPDGTIIEGNGITPDFEVGVTPEDIEAGRDPQLERAVELLKERL